MPGLAIWVVGLGIRGCGLLLGVGCSFPCSGSLAPRVQDFKAFDLGIFLTG